jgi:hypothetical protein
MGIAITMGLSDPVTAFNAESNHEAQMMRLYLEHHGVEAHVTYDDSLVGYWMFGRLPEIHKPQVWIDRSNIDVVRPLIEEFERQNRERNAVDEGDDVDSGTIAVVCEECGHTSQFPSSKKGTTQDCPNCAAYVDVGDVEP